jgi:hypothetical protein
MTVAGCIGALAALLTVALVLVATDLVVAYG